MAAGMARRDISIEAFKRSTDEKIGWLENRILNLEQDKQELLNERAAMAARFEALQQEVAELRAQLKPAAPSDEVPAAIAAGEAEQRALMARPVN